MKLDISIAFDDATYLTPQIYLYIESLKDKIPRESTLHITTSRKDNQIINYITNKIPNCKVYRKPPISELKSRCSYLLRNIEVETDADYVLKTDLDILFLTDFDEIQKLIKNDMDIYIQTENRRIIKDENLETRLWKRIYKELGYELPDMKLPYIEGHELGKPLFNSGAFIVRRERLKELQSNWIKKTQICEKWMDFNIHPNEFALTAHILCEKWKWMGLSMWLHFNPIAHYRKGEFPSQELINNCVLPFDVFMLHWHKPQWLAHLAKYNKSIKDIMYAVEEHIPTDWWNLSLNTFLEK